MMELKPIRTKRDYEKTLRAVSPSFDNPPQPGSPEGDRFEVLVMLIEAYEAKHYAIAPPDPIAAIKFRMDQAGLTAKDLAPMIGRTNRVYEVLNGKRALTLPMIRRLHSMLGIPAESLIS
jgi:HTH-type transcriptional regulator / antitoxin HigA